MHCATTKDGTGRTRPQRARRSSWLWWLCTVVAGLVAAPASLADPAGPQVQVSSAPVADFSSRGLFPEAENGPAIPAYSAVSREYLVVWREFQYASTEFGVLQRGVRQDGTPIGAAQEAPHTTFIRGVALAYGDNGYYMKVYGKDVNAGIRLFGAPLTSDLTTPSFAGVFFFRR